MSHQVEPKLDLPFLIPSKIDTSNLSSELAASQSRVAERFRHAAT